MIATEALGTTADAARAQFVARPLLRSADLRALLPVGRTRFYELTHQADFPSPVQFEDGGVYLWWAHEIWEWLTARPRAQRTPDTADVEVASQDEATPATAGSDRAPLRPAGRRTAATTESAEPPDDPPRPTGLVAASPRRSAR